MPFRSNSLGAFRSISIHPVVHVEHMKPARSQPFDIGIQAPEASSPFIEDLGQTVIEIGKILVHRQRGRGYRFLALTREAPSHQAERKPLRDFVDAEKTIIAALHEYIIEKNILHDLH